MLVINQIKECKMNKDTFILEVIEEVEKVLLQRTDKGVCESEADYLVGAMVVLTMVNQKFYGSSHEDSMSICPPIWTIYPMAGRSVAEEVRNDS